MVCVAFLACVGADALVGVVAAVLVLVPPLVLVALLGDVAVNPTDDVGTAYASVEAAVHPFLGSVEDDAQVGKVEVAVVVEDMLHHQRGCLGYHLVGHWPGKVEYQVKAYELRLDAGLHALRTNFFHHLSDGWHIELSAL